ncbi:MAG: MICOS complex subunit MIC60 [Verrucomicrobiota bacterium]|nr:MICOS complex subunit MIC60 [Verrucomicrobiota bacterium]
MVFAYETHKLPESVRRVTITGRWDFDVYEPEIVAELPLAKGFVYAKEGCRMEIADVELTRDTIELTANVMALGLFRRGTLETNQIGESSAFIFHPARKELLISNLSSRRFHYSLLSRVETTREWMKFERFPRVDYAPELATDWLRDARLYLIRSRQISSLSRPLKLKDAPLRTNPIISRQVSPP